MKIQDVATVTGKSQRTIIRYIDRFNLLNGKNLPKGVDAVVDDDELVKFIEGKTGVKIVNGVRKESTGGEIRKEVVDDIEEKTKPFRELKNTSLINDDILKLIEKSKKGRFKIGGISEKKEKRFDWRFWLVRLPLPMFGIVMSYGVYYFPLSLGVPMWVCIGGAMSLEMTYLGLTAMDGLGKEEREKANRVGVMAVVLSMFYNSVSLIIHMMEQRGENLLDELHWIWMLIFAVAHSCLALLAYQVGNLILHKKK